MLGLERSKSWGSMPATEFETGSLTIAVVDWTAFGRENSPNPNAIVLAASADQGRTFSTPVLVNDTGYSARPGETPLPGTEPSVIFTQTQVANAAVAPGSMSVLWSDVSTSASGTASPPGRSPRPRRPRSSWPWPAR